MYRFRLSQRMFLCLALAALALVPMTAAHADELAPNGGGGHNVVQIINHNAGQLQVAGNIQLNRIPGPTVVPVNEALVLNEGCTGCQSIAVALQIDLYGYNVTNFQPQNYAVALNVACTGCDARADAFQCGIQVQDPTQVPDQVNAFIASMRQTLASIQSDPTVTYLSAQTEIQGVVDQYNTLLKEQFGNPAGCQAVYDVPGL